MNITDRCISDLLLMAYATGLQDAMPTVSDARAVERFNIRFGHLCEECDTEALRKRLGRMKEEYHQSKRTK